MADREYEIGAVHGVEVEGIDAVLGELLDLAGRDRRRDQLACVRIVVEALALFREPRRHAGAGAFGEIRGLLEILPWENARHDRNRNAARPHPVEITEVE